MSTSCYLKTTKQRNPKRPSVCCTAGKSFFKYKPLHHVAESE